MASLDIIVVNWNSGTLLNECLNAVNQSILNNIEIETYVIDNDSKDQSDLCTSSYKHTTLIKNKKNVGFGAACNQGINAGKGKYVLLLNPDVVIQTTTLQDTITFMEQNLNVAVMGARHTDENGNTKMSCSRFPKLSRVLNDSLGLPRLFPKQIKSSTHMHDWDHQNSAYVDHVIGAYMCIRRSILDNVGLFDEQYFVYIEDLDLSKRISDGGAKIYYNTDISIYHEGGGTTKQIKTTRLLYSLQAKLIYYKKFFTPFKYHISLLLVLFIEPLSRTMLYLLKFDGKSIKSTWVAFFRLYKSFFRKNNQPTKMNS